jgi:hypothetical protein
MPEPAPPAREAGVGQPELGHALCPAAAADATIDDGAATVAPRRMLAPTMANDRFTILRRDRYLITVAPSDLCPPALTEVAGR